MSLCVCIIDTQSHSLAQKVVTNTLQVLSQCCPAQKVYWISDVNCEHGFMVPHEHIQISPIEQFPLDYNRVCLKFLPDLIQEDHCLIVQTDGFAVNAQSWNPEFLSFDYIGACWPESWNLPHRVGNGGFSLRSRKLLQSIKKLNVPVSDHHEDYQICLDLRSCLMHTHGCVWAPESLAHQFSIENQTNSEWLGKSFGFHGKHLINLYAREVYA